MINLENNSHDSDQNVKDGGVMVIVSLGQERASFLEPVVFTCYITSLTKFYEEQLSRGTYSPISLFPASSIWVAA